MKLKCSKKKQSFWPKYSEDVGEPTNKIGDGKNCTWSDTLGASKALLKLPAYLGFTFNLADVCAGVEGNERHTLCLKISPVLLASEMPLLLGQRSCHTNWSSVLLWTHGPACYWELPILVLKSAMLCLSTDSTHVASTSDGRSVM